MDNKDEATLASQSQAAQPSDLTDEQIEMAARGIYELLPPCQGVSAKEYPWQPGGNSIKQDEARRYARAAIAAHLAGQSQATMAVPEGWRAFIENCADMAGGMVSGNRLAIVAKELLAAPTAQEVTQQAAKAETAEQANKLMRKALEDIAQPADAGCGCSFPCRCNDDGAEAINAGILRGIASDTLAEVERLCRAQRTNKNPDSLDLAPITSTVSAPEEVRNQVLEEAAGACKPGLIDGATAYEIAAIRKCADAIRALRTTSGKGEAA